MLRFNRKLACLTLVCMFLVPASAFASKRYQVTGKVLEVSDKVIVILKDQEKFEIDRNTDTKIEGEIRVGGRVTVYYHMTAESVEAKR